jgi:hypothetical protein
MRVAPRAMLMGRGDEGVGDGDDLTKVWIQTTSDDEESATMLTHDGCKMVCQDLLQMQPVRRRLEVAEAFEPSSMMPSTLPTIFCSAALQSGATESLQLID